METSIDGARGVLINITGSLDMGLDDVELAASLVQEAAHPEANIIFGASFDEDMEDEIRVVVIATRFGDKAVLPGIGTTEKKPDIFSSGKLTGGVAAATTAAAAPTAPTAPTVESVLSTTAEIPEPAPPPPPPPEEDPFDTIFKIFNSK